MKKILLKMTPEQKKIKNRLLYEGITEKIVLGWGGDKKTLIKHLMMVENWPLDKIAQTLKTTTKYINEVIKKQR